MSEKGRALFLLVTFQALLIGVFYFVERGRADSREAILSLEEPLAVNGLLPKIFTQGRDGSRSELRIDALTLVHIWATWCPPCRTELPSLLSLQRKRGIDVVAIALDKNWQDVESFVDEQDIAKIVLAEDLDIKRALGVHTLPITFLVSRQGRVVARFEGVRDWSDEGFLLRSMGAFIGAVERGSPP